MLYGWGDNQNNMALPSKILAGYTAVNELKLKKISFTLHNQENNPIFQTISCPFFILNKVCVKRLMGLSYV